MYFIHNCRAHKVRQIFVPGSEPGEYARLIAYCRTPGGPAPEGVDLFECLWWVDESTHPATPGEVAAFLARPGLTRLVSQELAEAPWAPPRPREFCYRTEGSGSFVNQADAIRCGMANEDLTPRPGFVRE